MNQDNGVSQRPLKLFKLGQAVRVPKDVHPSEQATVVGVEWGPDNHRGWFDTPGRKVNTSGWIYRLKFLTGGQWGAAGEEDILKWQQETPSNA